MFTCLLLLILLGVWYDQASSYCDKTCQTDCLAMHNVYRKNHQVKPLKLDEKLMKQADEWANNNFTKSPSKYAYGGTGECWAWGNLYQSWVRVVKDWHDEEANIDWKTRKSKNSNTVYCFSQVVWERATKLGCGRGTLKSRPFYVAQMDIAAIVQEGTVGYELDNIKKPVQGDMK